MSQISPDQTGIGNPNIGPRNRGGGVRLQDLRGPLQTPGLSVPPPVDEGAVIAAQLERTLGITGDFASTVGSYEYRQKVLADERASMTKEQLAQQDRIEHQHEISQRGVASVHYQTIAPGIAQSIIDRSPGYTRQPDETDEQFAKRLTNSTFGDEHLSPAYKDQAREVLNPIVAKALTVQETNYANKARADETQQSVAATASAKTPDEVAEFVAHIQSVNPKMSESEAWSHILPAWEAAAKTRNQTTFDAIGSAVGDRFPLQRAEIEQAYRSAQHSADAATDSAFHNQIAGYLNPEDGPTPPYEVAVEKINSYRGTASENAIQGELDQLQAREIHARQQLLHQEARTQRQAIEHAAMMDLAGKWNAGSPAVARPIDLTLADGTTVKFTEQEQVKAANQYLNDQINTTYARDPVAKVKAQMALAARAPSFVVPEWEAAFKGVEGRVRADMSAGDVPKEATDAYSLYASLGAMDSTVRDRHMTTESKEFMRFTDRIVNSMRVGPANAMVTLRQVAESDPAGLGAFTGDIGSDEVAKAVRNQFDFSKTDVHSQSFITNQVRNRAQLYRVIARETDTDALAHAAKDVATDYKPVGGAMVDHYNRPAVDAASGNPAVSKSVIDWWADENKIPADQRRNFQLRTRDNSRSWYISGPGGVMDGRSPNLSDKDIEAVASTLAIPASAARSNELRRVEAKADYLKSVNDKVPWYAAPPGYRWLSGAIQSKVFDVSTSMDDALFRDTGLRRTPLSAKIAEVDPQQASLMQYVIDNVNPTAPPAKSRSAGQPIDFRTGQPLP